MDNYDSIILSNSLVLYLYILPLIWEVKIFGRIHEYITYHNVFLNTFTRVYFKKYTTYIWEAKWSGNFDSPGWGSNSRPLAMNEIHLVNALWLVNEYSFIGGYRWRMALVNKVIALHKNEEETVNSTAQCSVSSSVTAIWTSGHSEPTIEGWNVPDMNWRFLLSIGDKVYSL